MIRKTLFIASASLALCGVPIPAMAQDDTTAHAHSETDPAHLTAAQRVVDSIWPLGTYRKMMEGTMNQMMDAMFESMFDMRASDIVKGSGKEVEESDETLGEVIEQADPHFRERMKITSEVMTREMIPLMEKVEPTVRANMTAIYAERFSLAELNDLNAFFTTPTGKSYAAQSMLIYTDPKFMESMQAFVPEMMSAMPQIMQKVEEATAHLPPPPEPEQDDERVDDAA